MIVGTGVLDCPSSQWIVKSEELIGKFSFQENLVGPSGLEPPTSCLSGTRSNLLSYEPMWLVWCFFTLRFLFLDSRKADCSALPSLCQHRTIFPHSFPWSIVTTAELNFCVRNGNRWTLCVYNTDFFLFKKYCSLKIEQHYYFPLRPLRQYRFSCSLQTSQCRISPHCTFSIERRWSSRTFRYGYLVTT